MADGELTVLGLLVEALYGVAYTLKFASKKSLGRDFVVGPLEGLWRADDPTAFVARRKETWGWTMMICQPGTRGDARRTPPAKLKTVLRQPVKPAS